MHVVAIIYLIMILVYFFLLLITLGTWPKDECTGGTVGVSMLLCLLWPVALISMTCDGFHKVLKDE